LRGNGFLDAGSTPATSTINHVITIKFTTNTKVICSNVFTFPTPVIHLEKKGTNKKQIKRINIMPNIIVNKDLCTKCNTCATVCVMGIIKPATDVSYPRMAKTSEDFCMRCGHCESFCPPQALILDFNREEKIRFTASDSQIEPHKLSLYIKNRRSIRQFSSEPVSKDIITKVLDVVRYAPTGGNSQTVKWLVIYDRERVQQVAGLTVDWMRTIQNSPHPLANYVPGIIAEWDKGMDHICRNAPHLIFSHLPQNEFIDDRTDAIIALSYFDIAAPAFGLGTCWAGFIRMAVDSYEPLQKALALTEGRKIGYGMMFGYPAHKIGAIPRRNEADITWV
jgi:nitroreductase/ferredoxin